MDERTLHPQRQEGEIRALQVGCLVGEDNAGNRTVVHGALRHLAKRMRHQVNSLCHPASLIQRSARSGKAYMFDTPLER